MRPESIKMLFQGLMLQWRECLLISSVHLFQATFITLYSYTSVIEFKQLLSLLCACCLVFLKRNCLKRPIAYPQKPFSFCKMWLFWAKPIPERHSPVRGPGAKHTVQGTARSKNCLQLRHSHITMKSRIEGCRAGLVHRGVPGLEYCGLSFHSYTFTHAIIPAVLLCTYRHRKEKDLTHFQHILDSHTVFSDLQ